MAPPRNGTDPALILDHAPYVRELARKLVFDRDLAQDLQQEVLLRALENSPREPRALKSWLTSVLRHLAAKAFRSRARRSDREARAARREGAVPTPEEILAREDLRRSLVESVLALDEPVRSAMILRFLEELPPREVARRLGVPLETVRSRVRRGLEDLRSRLDRDSSAGPGSWCLAFVAGLRLEPPSLAAAAASIVGSSLPGVLAMSLAKKISLAAVALAILSTVLLVPWRDEPATSAGVGADPAVAREQPPATSGELSGGPADSESRIAASPSAGTEPKSAAEAEATGSLVAHVVWEDDKTPAPGVTVSLYRAGADALFEQPAFASDEHGEVRFARLAPGRVHLMILRGEAQWGDPIPIEAGREAETTLSVGPGMNCKGVVDDAAGRPIEGAEVLVAGWAGGEALPLARTAADGTFSLRAIATHCHVGARAPGYAASALRQFTSGKGAEVELKITLEKNAVELSGTVVDPDRRPVAGAVVQAGSEDASMVNLPDGGVGKRPMHARVRTDAQGRFRFESLPPGSTPVAVRARGLAPSHQTVELEPGRPLTIRVQLEPGVTLVGSVRDTQDAPVPKAELSLGEWDDLGHRQALSDEKGEFRVDGLASGEWKARAESDAKGKAEATLRAAPGATLRWDAVLSSGLELHGLVLDADGKPVPRAMVEANLEDPQRDDGWFGFANTDSDGRFTLKNCSAGRPLRIDVRRKSMFPELRLQHVVPGADELVVRLPKEAWIHIQGTVLDPEGKPLASVGVSPFKKGGNGSPAETADPKTGVFRLGPYPPGDYEISLQAGGYPRIHVPSRTVAPDETWDVGTLRFERGGTIVVDVAPCAGESAPEHRWFNVLDASGSPVETIDVAGGVGRGGPFAPGSYLLQYSGEGVAAGSLPFEVRAGSELRFDVALARGSPAEIECSMPEGTYSDFGVQVAITNSSGAPVFHGLAWATEGPMKLNLCLRPGEYRIEARRDSLRGEVALDVPADGSPAKASVVLAPR